MPRGNRERKLARELHARQSEAVVVPYIERSVGDWKPSANDCHRNVDWYCAHNPKAVQVRGWMYFDLLSQFVAHSVVEEGGTLLDITPSHASHRYPFVRHIGNEEDFIALVEAGVTNVAYLRD